MVVQAINPSAETSATGVSFVQKAQTTAANARPERLLFIGNYQEGKTVDESKIYSSSGNADDAGTMFGFGSPLHRMALKAHPADGSGCLAEAYFMAVPAAKDGVKHEVSVKASGTVTSNSTLYLRYKEQIFEAAADLASKISTSYQLNEALDLKGIKLNAFNRELIPFTVTKGMKAVDVLNTVKNQLDEYLEVPFTYKVLTGSASAAVLKGSAAVDCLDLNAEDYKIAISVNGGETLLVDVGMVDASTVDEVLAAVNAKLTGVTLSAADISGTSATYVLTSLTTGAASRIEISAPAAGTDLFAALNLSGSARGADGESLVLTAKVPGESCKFEVDFVDADGYPVTVDDYGINFDVTVTNDGAGIVKLDDVLENIPENLRVTRVCSQFNDDLALDAMKEYFMGFRDPLIAQMVLCYTARQLPENELVKGTVDLDKLKEVGTRRRDDSVNVCIYGDYGELRPLKWKERDQLLKSGIPNLVPLYGGGYEIGDLCTFYHPVGVKRPLYKYDVDVCVLGNMAYDTQTRFRDSDEWKSFILIKDNDKSSNPKARTLKALKTAINTMITQWGDAGWIADVEATKEKTVVEQDKNNPDRININVLPTRSGTGRILDIVNLVSFMTGS